MKDPKTYKKRNFGMALPFSALLLVGSGLLISVLIYLETGWSWHILMSPTGFGFVAIIVLSIFRDGNQKIEIGTNKISIIKDLDVQKTIFYSEIKELKYNYFPGCTSPTIRLISLNCQIDIDGEMDDFVTTINHLFYQLVENGRKDLVESYNNQFKKIHNIKT